MKAVERMHLGKVAEIGCIACLKAGYRRSRLIGWTS